MAQLNSRYVLVYRKKPVLVLPATLYLEKPLEEIRPEILSQIFDKAFADFFLQTGISVFVADTRHFSLPENASLWTLANQTARDPNTLNIFITDSVLAQKVNCGLEGDDCVRYVAALQGRGFFLLRWNKEVSTQTLESNVVHELGHVFSARDDKEVESSAMYFRENNSIEIDEQNLLYIQRVVRLIRKWNSFEPLFRLGH